MKINEIIIEGRVDNKPDYARDADTGEWVFRDDGTDRVYHLNRIMMAAAMHDGESDAAVDMDESSWVEKNNMARPYTDQEHKMMKGAFKTVTNSDYHETSTDNRSREADDVHKVSPVGRTGPIKRKSN